MPKLLIASSLKSKKDKKGATSTINMRKLIEERIAKDAEDVKYTVVTLNVKMKLSNVLALLNKPPLKVAEMVVKEELGTAEAETWTCHPDKKKGKWEVETIKLDVAKKEAPAADGDKPKKKKKKKKA